MCILHIPLQRSYLNRFLTSSLSEPFIILISKCFKLLSRVYDLSGKGFGCYRHGLCPAETSYAAYILHRQYAILHILRI